jgi:hypothetical protein
MIGLFVMLVDKKDLKKAFQLLTLPNQDSVLEPVALVALVVALVINKEV